MGEGKHEDNMRVRIREEMREIMRAVYSAHRYQSKESSCSSSRSMLNSN